MFQQRPWFGTLAPRPPVPGALVQTGTPDIAPERPFSRSAQGPRSWTPPVPGEAALAEPGSPL